MRTYGVPGCLAGASCVHLGICWPFQLECSPRCSWGSWGWGEGQFQMPEGLEGLMEFLRGCPMHSLLTMSSLSVGVKPRSALCFQQTRFAAGVVRAVVAGCVKRMYLPGLCWGLGLYLYCRRSRPKSFPVALC